MSEAVAEGPGGVPSKVATKNEYVGVLMQSELNRENGGKQDGGVASGRVAPSEKTVEDKDVESSDSQDGSESSGHTPPSESKKNDIQEEVSGEKKKGDVPNGVRPTRPSVVDTIATCSSYMDDATTKGNDPHALYGSFTWKVPNFRDVSKRELKSSSFSVGPYKWYILVYPNGCDVNNHLSLFLCVADYDKLLPGWSHFAQFTIAVVNKDPKKSKYSDTLHRFCKKEHDWGWKKFMELGKMADGFVVGDTLVIKVQVQVIKDRQNAPFRTLDAHYRRELIRVYLSNIEGVVRRAVDKAKEHIQGFFTKDIETFWSSLSEKERSKLSSSPSAPLLKKFVKTFFNEKEVTSTLMMDAAYAAIKVLDRCYKRKFQDDASSLGPNSVQSLERYVDSLEGHVYLDTSKNVFTFNGDALERLKKFLDHPFNIYPFDSNETSRDAKSAEAKDSAERDEIRLVDLARLTIEVFAMSHIAKESIEKSWIEAEIIRRQEELIREEEEASKDEAERLAAKAEAERERKARKRERQRAKKEAERAKQEALEAAKAREEELKRAEQEKKRQEAEERRKQEEAKKEAERLKKLEQKQASLAAKKAAKPKPSNEANNVQEHKTIDIQSTQFDSDSVDSSTMTSARSDQSSLKSANRPTKAANGASSNAQEVESQDRAERASSQDAGSTEDNIVAEMRLLLEKRDDEIVSLKNKVRHLEQELETATSKISRLSMKPGTSPSTPPRNLAGTGQMMEEALMASRQNNSPLMKQPSDASTHSYLMQQMAKVSNPSDAILASAISQRGADIVGDSMRANHSHPEVSNMISQGVNYTVNPTSLQGNPARPQNGSSGQQYQGYNGSVLMNSGKPVGYRQFSHQNSGQSSATQQVLPNTATIPNIGMATQRLGPQKMNTSAANQPFGPPRDMTHPNQRSFAQNQGNQQTGEPSALDDFAHLGLITDLLE